MYLFVSFFLTACAPPKGNLYTADDALKADGDSGTPSASESDGQGSSEDSQSQDTPPDGDTDDAAPSETTEADDARIVDVDFPGEINCGETSHGEVWVENTGTATWSRDGGFKLGAVDDSDALFDSSDVRVWLANDVTVAPGQTHLFDIDLRAPDIDGNILTDWQMVHEGIHWFGEIAQADVRVSCDEDSSPPEEEPDSILPLPDMSHLVVELAEEHPEMLAGSCLDDGGGWAFLDELVDRLRETDERWGYNWKRGVEGDPSEDVVDYHYGSGTREGSEDVYIIDVIVGHCGDDPHPGWLDQTEATADAGTIGRWTGRGRF